MCYISTYTVLNLATLEAEHLIGINVIVVFESSSRYAQHIELF